MLYDKGGFYCINLGEQLLVFLDLEKVMIEIEGNPGITVEKIKVLGERGGAETQISKVIRALSFSYII